MTEVLESVIKATAAVKKKYRQLKASRAQAYDDASRAFQPIIEPLQSLVEAKKKKVSMPETDDAIFGPENKDGGLYLGNRPYEIIGNKIRVGDLDFHKSPGLLELIHRHKPDPALIGEEDRLNYRKVLFHTNVHKEGFTATGKIRGYRGYKYKHVIKDLVSQRIGTGLVDCRKPNGAMPLVSNDPNELCARLRLLMASQAAGHTGHKREINAIISKLRADKYIM